LSFFDRGRAAVSFPLTSLVRLDQQLFVMLDGLDRLFDKFGSAFRVGACELTFRAFRAHFILLERCLAAASSSRVLLSKRSTVFAAALAGRRDGLAEDRRVIRRRRDHQGCCGTKGGRSCHNGSPLFIAMFD